MINRPTVLILGAGASAHAGYPLGRQLISDLSLLRKADPIPDISDEWSGDVIHQFLTRLTRSGHYSIDAFLESFPDQADLGKYLIAQALKRHEDLDRLFPPHDSGWYQYLFNRLLDNGGGWDFSESQLSIVTFNYDRSLEAYLHEALKARFNLNDGAARNALKAITIVHVHGTLGEYPEVPYTSVCEPNLLGRISRQIKIIHEVQDTDAGFCSPEFKIANGVLRQAERIFFLGFGFHPDNLRRFRFFGEHDLRDKEIYACVYGMGSVDQTALANRLETIGIPKSSFNGNMCNNFFSHCAELI